MPSASPATPLQIGFLNSAANLYLRSQAEIAASAAIFDHVRGGRTIILLAGFAGVGKSAMLRRIAEDWQPHFRSIALAERGAVLANIPCTEHDLLLVDEAEELGVTERAYLEERVRAGLATVIVAARPDDVRALPPGTDLAIVRLEPFLAEEVCQLATALADDIELSEAVLSRISHHSEGRPRLVRSLLRSAAIEAALDDSDVLEPTHIDVAAARLALRNGKREAGREPQFAYPASKPLIKSRRDDEISIIQMNDLNDRDRTPQGANDDADAPGLSAARHRGRLALTGGVAALGALAASYLFILSPQLPKADISAPTPAPHIAAPGTALKKPSITSSPGSPDASGDDTRIAGDLAYSEPTEPIFENRQTAAPTPEPGNQIVEDTPAPRKPAPAAQVAILSETEDPASLTPPPLPKLKPAVVSGIPPSAATTALPRPAVDATDDTGSTAIEATREARDRLRAIRN